MTDCSSPVQKCLSSTSDTAAELLIDIRRQGRNNLLERHLWPIRIVEWETAPIEISAALQFRKRIACLGFQLSL